MSAVPLRPFKQPPRTVRIVSNGRACGTITLGGSVLRIMLATGREIHFEMHPYFGPIPINKRTEQELVNVPLAFWEAFEAWEKFGRLVDGDRCVFGKAGGLVEELVQKKLRRQSDARKRK